ncbi:MAG TPA: DUF58 domain-containing protein [Aggregatilineaceae bacterium]|jgi:uncharacterized protein (DUF58 family)|nr:DUF58 domain-containing protein [Aggregatilineaceae bacterium]
MAERIFDEKTLRKLDRLIIVANRIRSGAIKGERRSSRRGTSIEFADYRNYVRGDDLRRVDWNIYARLERPFIKLLEDEEDLALHLLLDASASMDWPRSGNHDLEKFLYARRVVAGLAYIALGSGDQVTVSMLREGGVGRWGPLRGRGHILGLLAWLEKATARGSIDLNQSLRDYAVQTARAGVCVVLSDFMSPEGFEDGLRALQGRGHEVTAIHILSPDEISPEITGDLKLVDVETGASQDVTIDAAMLELYLQRLQAWQAEIGAYCTRRGIHYVPIDTRTPWEQLILSELRRARVVH